MNRDDIIRLAREAGVFEVSYPHPAGNMVEVERFAALVAAAEREACAKICEQLQDWPEGATPDDCAKAIRAGR